MPASSDQLGETFLSARWGLRTVEILKKITGLSIKASALRSSEANTYGRFVR